MSVVVAWTPILEPWPEAVLQRVRQFVPPRQFDDALRFRRWQDRQGRLSGRLLLRRILRAKGLADRLDDMEWTSHGRPFIAGCGDFSISHTASAVLCAWVPHGRVGIDIEGARVDFAVGDVMPWMSDGERRRILASSAPVGEALRIWTVKEAVCKADGRGIAGALPDCATAPVLFGGQRWRVRSRRVAGHHVALARPIGEAMGCRLLGPLPMDAAADSSSTMPAGGRQPPSDTAVRAPACRDTGPSARPRW